jgi:hypothetical protein
MAHGESIDTRALATYLQRHLAGAGAADSLAADLMEETLDGPTILFLQGFRRDIEEEARSLQELVDRFGGGTSLLQGVSSIASEVVGLIGRSLPQPQLLEVELLEVLSAGVWGKRLMWGVLAEIASETEPPLDRAELAVRMRRADRQRAELGRLHDAAVGRSLRCEVADASA